MALSDNLIAYWSLDEASGNAIDAHDDNDLTDNNTVGATTGIISGCRDFEADNTEFFHIVDNTDLSVGNIDFTIALWANAENIDTFRPCVSKWNGGSTKEFLLAVNSNKFDLFYSGDGSEQPNLPAATFGNISLATWYFVVFWHDATANQVGIAVNAGTADTASHSTGIFDGTSQFQIGGKQDGGNWDGLIDEVGFWKRVLTEAERTELYNAGAGRDYAYITGGAGFIPYPFSRGLCSGAIPLAGGLQ